MTQWRTTALRGALAGATLAAILAIHAPALAQSATENEARQLFKEGLTLHEAGNFDGALVKYDAAYERWKNPKILLNIGTAAWELGRFALAARAYDRFLADTPADDPNRGEVEKALNDVRSKIGTVEVRLVGDASAISVDGETLDRTLLDRVRVAPGTHVFAATGAGGTGAKESVSVSAGQTLTVTLTLGANPSADSAETAVEVTPEQGKKVVHHPALPWIVGGVGVAGLVASGAFLLLRNGKIDDLEQSCIDGVCPDSEADTIDDAKRFGIFSAVSLGVGIAGIGTGVALLILDSRRPEAAAGWRFDVATAPRGASATARYRF